MNDKDVEQLTRTVAQCADALVLYARQWLDGASADDAVQDALVALLSQRQPPRNPTAWLYRAVRNAAIDAARSTARRRRREQSVARTRGEWFESRPDDLLDAQAAEHSLRQLSPEQREVVVLRIWSGLGFAEIAEIMQLGVSTVHDRYRAALRELRCALEQSCPKTTT
jgi:RNA polymerase sigma-70 factor (ECF subfamily)